MSLIVRSIFSNENSSFLHTPEGQGPIILENPPFLMECWSFLSEPFGRVLFFLLLLWPLVASHIHTPSVFSMKSLLASLSLNIFLTFSGTSHAELVFLGPQIFCCCCVGVASKPTIPQRRSLKKSKKRQAITSVLIKTTNTPLKTVDFQI